MSQESDWLWISIACKQPHRKPHKQHKRHIMCSHRATYNHSFWYEHALSTYTFIHPQIVCLRIQGLDFDLYCSLGILSTMWHLYIWRITLHNLLQWLKQNYQTSTDKLAMQSVRLFIQWTGRTEIKKRKSSAYCESILQAL